MRLMMSGRFLRKQGSAILLRRIFSRLRTSGFRIPLAAGLCGVLALACATAPRSAEQDGLGGDSLPPGAVLYGYAGMRRAAPLIESLIPEQFNSKQTAAFMKQTDWAIFGLYRVAREGKESAAQSVFLITRGHYPAFSYNAGFALSPGWKSAVIDGRKGWQQGAAALSIEKNRAYIRLGDIPVADAASRDAPNEELGAFFAGAKYASAAQPDEPPVVFASFIPSSEAAGFIRSTGIPLDITLENITLELAADGAASYRSALKLKTKSPSEAKALSAILSLARALIGNRAAPGLNAALAGLLFENPPMLDGNTITVNGAFPMETLVSSIEQQGIFQR
ncbi:MAG: hypothetical protein LBL31_00615 [Spirochaetaceae bacterium]|nr:hypothetical protein [Spirochaetaceae bacterium]